MLRPDKSVYRCGNTWLDIRMVETDTRMDIQGTHTVGGETRVGIHTRRRQLYPFKCMPLRVYLPSVCMFLHAYVSTVCISRRLFLLPPLTPCVCLLRAYLPVCVHPSVCMSQPVSIAIAGYIHPGYRSSYGGRTLLEGPLKRHDQSLAKGIMV